MASYDLISNASIWISLTVIEVKHNFLILGVLIVSLCEMPLKYLAKFSRDKRCNYKLWILELNSCIQIFSVLLSVGLRHIF